MIAEEWRKADTRQSIDVGQLQRNWPGGKGMACVAMAAPIARFEVAPQTSERRDPTHTRQADQQATGFPFG